MLRPHIPTRPKEDAIDAKRAYEAFMSGVNPADRSPVVSYSGGRVHIVLPLPPKECQQNSRCHFMAKARAVKKLREEACRVTLQARILGDILAPWKERVEAEVYFYCPDNRQRDSTNLMGGLKAAWDGIEDAGLVKNDKQIFAGVKDMQVDKERPRCEVIMWQVATIEGQVQP